MYIIVIVIINIPSSEPHRAIAVLWLPSWKAGVFKINTVGKLEKLKKKKNEM
jgi:hypothetical protein